ncbi:MAG TPA: ABC transporter substrate-binding protein [Rhizomicrobium sp.]|nr:ABC transporter substrate-binding protein [Rhizomicrobium sp.]
MAAPVIAAQDHAWAQAKRGTLNAILADEPATLNYPLYNTRLTQQVCGNINESLLLFDWQFQPRPNLAKSLEISPDKLTYTFHLERNVQWHDGAPFSARDVVFSSDVMLRQLNPRSRAAISHCASIKALDPYTVEYRLKQPFNAFLTSFMASSGPMMPAHIYEGTNFRTNPYNYKPVGTGPFKFEKWERGQFVHLVRNENYWRRDRPFLKEIYFRIIPAAEQRMVAMQTGTVDIAFGDDIDPVVASRLLASPDLQCVTNAYQGTGEIGVMEVNQRRWPFSDRRFRAALMHAIDRQFMVDGMNFGQGKVVHGPLPSTATYFDDKALVKYPFDPARARALLDETGLKPKTGGTRLKFGMMIMPDGGGAWTRCAQYARQALSQVGLDVELQSADWATFSRRNGDWEFDLCWNNYGLYGDPAIGTSRFYISSNIRKGVSQTNVQGYVNPEIDALFAKAAVAVSREEAQTSYSRVQQVLSRDVAMLWMFERKPPLFYNKRFRDVVTGPNGPSDGFGDMALA